MEEYTKHRTIIDGGWGWMIVFASFASNFLLDGISFSYGVLLPDLTEELQESQARISVIGSVFNALGLLTGPINSILVNRFGCRIVCMTGSLIIFVSVSITSCLNSFWPMLFTFGIIGGIGMGLMYLPTIVSVSQYFDRKRSLATGIALCGSGLGVVVMPPFIRLLLDYYGWRGTLMLMGGIMLQGTVTGSLLRDLPVEKIFVSPTSMTNQITASKSIVTISPINSSFSLAERTSVIIDSMPQPYTSVSNPSLKQNNKVEQKFSYNVVSTFQCLNLLNNWQFLVILLANFLIMTGFLAPVFFSVAFSLSNGISKNTAAYQLSVFGLSATLGRIVLGYLSGIRRQASLLVYCLALLISGLALTIMLPLSKTVSLIMTYISIHGFFCTNFIGLTSVVLCDLFGVENISNSFGLVSFVRGVSGSLGPLFIGHMYDVYGKYEMTFSICGGIFLLGTFLYFIILFTNRKQTCTSDRKNSEEIDLSDI